MCMQYIYIYNVYIKKSALHTVQSSTYPSIGTAALRTKPTICSNAAPKWPFFAQKTESRAPFAGRHPLPCPHTIPHKCQELFH